MTTTVEAIYENGTLKVPDRLPLPDKTPVIVTIRMDASEDSEREAWLELSEETLTNAWSNPGDDIFNELLQK